MINLRIAERVKTHAEEVDKYLMENGNKAIRLISFVTGSQAYGLDNPQSDVDTIHIVVPNTKGAALGYCPSIELHIKNENDIEEHAIIWTLNHMFEILDKGSDSLLPSLMTPYIYNNLTYSDYGIELISRVDWIAERVKENTMKALAGCALSRNHRRVLWSEEKRTAKECAMAHYWYGVIKNIQSGKYVREAYQDPDNIAHAREIRYGGDPTPLTAEQVQELEAIVNVKARKVDKEYADYAEDFQVRLLRNIVVNEAIG